MTHLIDSAKGNTNTKIIALLTILREQLNRIEERLNRLEECFWWQISFIDAKGAMKSSFDTRRAKQSPHASS